MQHKNHKIKFLRNSELVIFFFILLNDVFDSSLFILLPVSVNGLSMTYLLNFELL